MINMKSIKIQEKIHQQIKTYSALWGIPMKSTIELLWIFFMPANLSLNLSDVELMKKIKKLIKKHREEQNEIPERSVE